MLRTIVILTLTGFISACISSSATRNMVENKSPESYTKSSELEGVYEFVSETTVEIFPEQLTTKRQADEWQGFWFFQGGHFSKVMMKNERPEWMPGKFPSDARGTGFDAGAGKYQVDGDIVELNYLLAYYPGAAYKQEIASFAIEDNSLTLRRSFGPIRESMSKGEQITVLRRIKTTP